MEDEKFNQVAELYAKYRPSYPEEYIKYIITKCNLNENSIIADIGAGTGILSKQLLDNNLKVIGVEPNNEMRKILEEKLKNNKNFISINGTDKNTNLKKIV